MFKDTLVYTELTAFIGLMASRAITCLNEAYPHSYFSRKTHITTNLTSVFQAILNNKITNKSTKIGKTWH